MPLHAGLLQPISSEAPAGVDLAYDRLYEQIKEARLEDDDSLPTGSWTRAPKKADRPLVIRLAGEALATRSKDLRLAGWYFESLLRQEGFPQLTPILEALHKLQVDFWESLHPLPDEDGDLGRRAGALESIAVQLAGQLRLLALTRSGVDFLGAQAARTLGYEADATTKEKKELREDAVKRGRVLLEELDKAVADTPKAFYEETEAALGSATLALVALDTFHEERYGEDPPSLVRLKTALEDLHKFVAGVLAEKRKLEPDAEPEAKADDPSVTPADPFARFDAQGSGGGTTSPTETVAASAADESRAEPKPGAAVATSDSAAAPAKFAPPAQSAAEPGSWEAALAQVAGAVRFLSRGGLSPETAYTLAAAPGVALLFRAGHDYPWPAPAAGVRQNLRKLARERKWAALEEAGLQALAESPATIWLDLHRYLWQAAAELGHRALAAAVLATVRGFLEQLPDLDMALLDDDTPSASMETQSWLRALHPELNGGAEGAGGKASAATLASFVHASTARNGNGGAEMDAFTQALGLLKQGKSAEAIHLLSRDAEQQPSGRLRFERRLQTAELCLQAGHAAVAQPLLADLTAELERRTLEGWESSSLLGKPLALMIRCLDLGTTSSDNRAALFARLCRLDPVAAAALNRPPSGGAS